MTHAFKRIVGLLLAVMLIFSVCTVAFAEEPAELTANDLGVTAGDNIALYDDPVVAGGKVFKLNTTSSRPNFELADPVDHTKPFEPVAGTHYTIKFDYYLDAATNALDFALYYGAQSKYTANYSKSAITGAESGISLNFAGDGKWHTGAISFTAAEVKGKVNGVADQVLPYLYLTYYAGDADENKTLNGYLKNITIIEDDDAVKVSNNTYDLGYYFDENGDLKENLTYKYSNNDVPYTTTNISKNDAGEYVVTPGSDVFETTTNNRKIGAYDYVSLTSSTGALAGTIHGDGAWNQVFVVKYKVTKIGDSGFAGLGVGRASTTYASTCVYNAIKHTSTTSEWKYYLAAIQGEANSSCKLRLTVAGIGSEIVIDTIQVAIVNYTKISDTAFTGLNAGIVCYNDNGALKVHAQYDGTSLIHTPENGYMGEKSDTWCSDQTLTTPVETSPVDNTTLATGGTKTAVKMVYAKYDTVVIDTFPTDVTFKKDVETATSAVNNYDYVALASSGASAMMMVPAYSGYGSGDGGTYDFYKFTNGAQYHFVIEVSGISVAADTTNGIQFIAATSASVAGGRDTGNTPTLVKDLDGTVTSMTLSSTLTYKSKWGDANYAIRNSNNKANIRFNVDKIIITKITDNVNYALVTLNDETSMVKRGTTIELPAQADTETEMFVGWYKSSAYVFKGESSPEVGTDDIVLPGCYVVGGFEEVTLLPKFISKEAVKVEFDATKYGEVTQGGGDIGGKDGQLSIVTDDAVDTEGLSADNTYLRVNTTANNIYKASLFKSDNSRVLVYEGVNYKIDMRYKVITGMTADNRTGGNIAICRNPINNYKPDALYGPSRDSSSLVKATEATDTFVEVSKTFHNKYMYSVTPGTGSASYDIKVNNQLAVMLPDGDIYIDYVTVTPVSYAPSYINYDETKGTVNVDYANGKLEIIPNDGYAVSTKSVRVLMNYSDFTRDADTDKVTKVDHSHELLSLKTTDGINYTFSTDYADYAWRIGALSITVDFVEADAANAEIIAASVRAEDKNAATYVSAGLRFRGRIAAEDVANATEIGFVAVPTNALGNGTIAAYMAGADTSAALTGVAYNAAESKNICYATLKDENDNVTFYDYQLLIKNLTKADGSLDLTNLKINVAMYITDANGDTVYVNEVKGLTYAQFAK